MESVEKMEVAKELMSLYARTVTTQKAVENIVAKYFMTEMDAINKEDAKAVLKAVVQGALDPENELNAKQEKLQPWIDKVLNQEKGKEEAAENG